MLLFLNNIIFGVNIGLSEQKMKNFLYENTCSVYQLLSLLGQILCIVNTYLQL